MYSKRKKRSYSLSLPIFFPSSLRKNPAERMNYLELMVSAELFLLIFIPNFETQINGPAGKWDKWLIFQAQRGMAVVCQRWKGVLFHGC